MITVKAFLKNGVPDNISILRSFELDFPYQYRNTYLRNARKITPVGKAKKKGKRLKDSVGTQIMGNNLKIVWRSPYAAAVNAGGHTDRTTHFAPALGFGRGTLGSGKTRKRLKAKRTGYMTRPGWHHPYTKPSKGFINKIYTRTYADMEFYVRNRLAKAKR